MNYLKNFNFKNLLINTFSKNLLNKKSFLPLVCNNNLPINREFSCLSNIKNTINLTCTNLSIVPTCGMKVKAKLQRRCKDCYFARIDGRMMVLCDSYGRHKQMALVRKQKYYWILTHCTQSKIRPY